VVHLGRDLEPEADLEGQVGLAVGIPVAEDREHLGQARSAHSYPSSGSFTGTSTSSSPASRASASPCSTTISVTSGWTTATPRSGAITARLPRRSRVPSPRSQPSTRVRLYGSRWSKPFVTSMNRVVSRTDLLKHPRAAVSEPTTISGPFGMRPYVHFSPNRPVKPAGMRREPPPSPPVPVVTRPPATAAAPPPVEPPGVCASSHGLRVTPLRLVRVRFT